MGVIETQLHYTYAQTDNRQITRTCESQITHSPMTRLPMQSTSQESRCAAVITLVCCVAPSGCIQKPAETVNNKKKVDTDCRFKSCPQLATCSGSRNIGPRKHFGHECSRGCPNSTRHAASSTRYYAVLGHAGFTPVLLAPGATDQTNERRYERNNKHTHTHTDTL